MNTFSSIDGSIHVTLPGPPLNQHLRAWFDRIDTDLRQTPGQSIAISAGLTVALFVLTSALLPSAWAIIPAALFIGQALTTVSLSNEVIQ